MGELWVPSKDLHLPPPSAEEFGKTGLLSGALELGAWDKDHKIIQQFREPSRSPVRAMLDIFICQMGNQAVLVTDTGGTSRSITPNAAAYRINAALADDTHGVVIGTGTTVVDMTDTKLVTQILHGSTSGKMVHNAVVVDATITILDPNATFIAYRNFNNNSGGSITVGETALYSNEVSAWKFCIFRDVPTALAVPDGGGCYVKYSLKISE